jgi:ElaB/YqjD/DUF883 family membrane-anchored ribosome-binding protein
MWRYLCVALLLAWPSHATDWSEIESALLDEQRAWTLASESSTGLTDYFASERLRLTSEREGLAREKASLETERLQWQQERDALETLRRQLVSDRKQIAEDSTRLDAREKQIERVGWMLRAAPWVAVGVFAAGVVVGVVVR